jgi:transcriptional regulator with XRE-family HTH domain
MAPKAQHAPQYLPLPVLLRTMRKEAGMTQRQLGAKMGKPQSWIHNCEVANRRVDVTEFNLWAKACGIDPMEAFRRTLKM